MFLARYWTDINDMPIGSFYKCLAGDLKKVSKNGHYSPSKLVDAWSKLFNQHIKAHGLPEVYVKYMDKMTKAYEYYDKAYNGHRWHLLRARIYEAEAEALMSGEGEKIETTCAHISKFMGFPVRSTECSVIEFYNYVAIMSSN